MIDINAQRQYCLKQHKEPDVPDMLALPSCTVEVYPGPGENAYCSDLYAVEVYDGASWLPSYLYQVSRLATCYGWHRGSYPSVSFTTFGTTGEVAVRLIKKSGAISNVEISPEAKNIIADLQDDKAVFVLRPNDKAWITVDDDDANPVFIFADAPKPAVPADAEYFGPGVHTIGQLHAACSDRAIYLDGGAWVKGNIDIRGKHNVTIMGPGVLSGELWTGESLQGKSFEDASHYFMILGATHDAESIGNRLEGITIVNSPSYNTFHGLQQIYSVKLISPWFGSTDGFYPSPNPYETIFVDQCFAFVGDDVFFPRDNFMGNMLFSNSFVSSSNNNIFCMSYWANTLAHDYTMLARNIDIKVCPENAVFQCVIDGYERDSGTKNQIFEDIRIEGDLNLNCRLFWIENRQYPWVDDGSPCNGNTYHLCFRNITVSGRQNMISLFKGKDADNGHHDILFENVKIGGVTVTEENKSRFIEMNCFARDIRFQITDDVS